MKMFFAILLLAVTAKADFKEVDPADLDMAVRMLVKNMGSCWNGPQRRVSVGVDSITNKTSQSIDKEKLAGVLVDALGNLAKFDVVEQTPAPKVRLVIQGKIEEAAKKYQGTYDLEFSIQLLNGQLVCKDHLTLTKSALLGAQKIKR